MATVALAGPVLSLEAGHTSVHTAKIIVNLALVVALPLVAGIVLRGVTALEDRVERSARVVALAAVAERWWLSIAAEVHLARPYFAVALALIAFLAASAVLGVRSFPRARRAILLTTSMRDFAIAASLAVAAFGPRAAAPLGLYGILVLVWGTAAAGLSRRHDHEGAAVAVRQ